MALILAILELYSEQAHIREHRKEVQAKKGIKIPILRSPHELLKALANNSSGKETKQAFNNINHLSKLSTLKEMGVKVATKDKEERPAPARPK